MLSSAKTPGSHALVAFTEFYLSELIILGEEQVATLQVAVAVLILEEGMRFDEPFASIVHGQEAIQERECRELTGFALQPIRIGTICANTSSIVITLIGLFDVSDV